MQDGESMNTKWEDWLVANHEQTRPMLGHIHRLRQLRIGHILNNSKIISIELTPTLSSSVSQIFTLHLQQLVSEYENQNSRTMQEMFEFSSLSIFFKKHENLHQSQDGAIRLHLQLDYIQGNGPDLTEYLSINGFSEEDENHLKKLVYNPKMRLWFYKESNIAILSFDDDYEKPIRSIVFEATEIIQGAIALKFSYILQEPNIL